MYDPKTAFGDPKLIEQIKWQAAQDAKEEEDGKKHARASVEATEYTLEWRCPNCKKNNSETACYEEFDEEQQCIKCREEFILDF
jgi:hypothetical protein